MWSYNSPIRVLFGNDGSASIAPLIDGRPYALVTYADAPFRALADQVTKEAGKPLIVVNDIAPNPDCKLLSEQSARFASLPSEPEVIVALGGGLGYRFCQSLCRSGWRFQQGIALSRNWRWRISTFCHSDYRGAHNGRYWQRSYLLGNSLG